jgi:hypothetical protein
LLPGGVEQISPTDSIRLLIVHLVSLTNDREQPAIDRRKPPPRREQVSRRGCTPLEPDERSGADQPRTCAAPFPPHNETSKEGGRIGREPHICGLDRNKGSEQNGTIQAPSSGARTRRPNRLTPPFLPLSLRISLNRLVPIAARRIDGRTSNQGRVRAPGDAGAMGAGVGPIEVPQRRPPEHDPVRGALPGAEAGSTHAELRREPPSLIPLRSGEPQTIHQVRRPGRGVSPGAPARLLGGEPPRPRRHDPGGTRPGRTAPRGAVRRHLGTARRPKPDRHRQPERLGLRPARRVGAAPAVRRPGPRHRAATTCLAVLDDVQGQGLAASSAGRRSPGSGSERAPAQASGPAGTDEAAAGPPAPAPRRHARGAGRGTSTGARVSCDQDAARACSEHRPADARADWHLPAVLAGPHRARQLVEMRRYSWGCLPDTRRAHRAAPGGPPGRPLGTHSAPRRQGPPGPVSTTADDRRAPAVHPAYDVRPRAPTRPRSAGFLRPGPHPSHA